MENFQHNENEINNLDSLSANTQIDGEDIQNQITTLIIERNNLPDKISAFEFIGADDRKIVSYELNRIKKKFIKQTLIIGDQIINEEYLPTELYPIIHFVKSHAGHPYKTYGDIHLIKDIVKAMNKFWSMLIYDMQVNNNRKVLYPKGSIQESSLIESLWSRPGAWIQYNPDPSLPNGGRPDVIEPSGMNQSIQFVLQNLLQLAEYITGIFGVMQGNSNEAPSTFGATQSLQSFGTQRIKLASRSIESSYKDMMLVLTSYIQKYAPRDKVIKYFDANNDMQEVNLMANNEDFQFKVRVDFVNQLPTVRQMMANMLTSIARNSGNPQLQEILTKLSIDLLDLPKSKEIGERMDITKNMQAQITQLEQQIQDLIGQNRALTNNMQQQQVKQKIELSAANAIDNINTEQALTEQELVNQQNNEPDDTIM
jgi:hypothetical protein